ncbi:hypothetical protein ABVT39_001097 [Epinephelus coioides]
MRGLTLLCLVGFILAASLSEGGTVPLAKREIKTTPPPFSVWSPLESDVGFPNESHTGNVTQTMPPPFSTWSPLESDVGFPNEPHTGNVTQGNQA